jgi:hypothetical protein
VIALGPGTRMCIATDIACAQLIMIHIHTQRLENDSCTTDGAQPSENRKDCSQLRQDFPVRNSSVPQGDAHGYRNQIKALIFEITAPEIDRMHFLAQVLETILS